MGGEVVSRAFLLLFWVFFVYLFFYGIKQRLFIQSLVLQASQPPITCVWQSLKSRQRRGKALYKVKKGVLEGGSVGLGKL